MTSHPSFEFRRAADDVVYRFERKEREDRSRHYWRSDEAVCVMFQEGIGWLARDVETGEATGMPWCVPPDQQNRDHPPAGDWVSRKGAKAYVYELAFVTTPK